jgi:hypothetical protein
MCFVQNYIFPVNLGYKKSQNLLICDELRIKKPCVILLKERRNVLTYVRALTCLANLDFKLAALFL